MLLAAHTHRGAARSEFDANVALEEVAVLRVLWVTTEPPDRTLGGASIRQAHLLQALGEQAEVTLVLCGGSLRDEGTLSRLHRFIEQPGHTPVSHRFAGLRRLGELRRALFIRQPPEVAAYRATRARLRRAWQEFGEHEVVIIEHPGLAPLIALRGSERWLFTLHNVGSGTLEQQAATNSGRHRWLYNRQASQARRFERWALETYDRVVSVSGEDARLLPGPTAVVPNGVDLSRFTATPLPSDPHIVLTGTLGYLPNVDGATWFVREVLPLIRTQVPNATLTLVGRSPTQAVRELARVPGVTVHADVPDVRPYLLAARATVVPLRVGTGTRLKALESFAAYRPVVGTTVGLAGLGIEPGVHAFVADDAESFAKRTIELLTNDARANELVQAGRDLVESQYRWEAIGDQFVEVVESLHASVSRPRQ
jgi:glycosyltransferase involved in cell wall biosynthesis